MTTDTAALFEKVRAETAQMLGFDILCLTPAQGVRLDRATALRLEVDRILSLQMRGEPIDVGRLTTASIQLEEMLGEAQPDCDLSRLTDEELDVFDRLVRKASGTTLEIGAVRQDHVACDRTDTLPRSERVQIEHED